MKHTRTLSAVLLATAGISSVQGAVIGIDIRNGFAQGNNMGTGSDFDSFRAVIISMDHTIVPISSFDDLAGIDMLIMQNPYESSDQFSSSERASISSFVSNGMGMLAIADGGGRSSDYISNMNQISSGFGATFSQDAGNRDGLVINNFASHAVTAGLNRVGLDFNRTISVSGSAIDLTGDDSDFLVVNNGVGGEGNSVFIGDSSLWVDSHTSSDYALYDLDNELLLRNIINYTVPTPSTLALFACCGLITRRRRN